MATVDDLPITIASPEDITSSEYDVCQSPVSQTSAEYIQRTPSPEGERYPIRRLEPIERFSHRGKFKQRINKIKFKRKPSMVQEHPLESPSLSDTPLNEPQVPGVNLTSGDLTHVDTSLGDIINDYEAYSRVVSEEPITSEPIPVSSLDLSIYTSNVLCIKILGSDSLKPHISLSHPLVKVTLYCDKTCAYFKKSEKNRAVSFFYETANDNVDYILPQLTEPAVVNTSNKFTPRWVEELVFNEDLSYLLSSTSLVLLFEMLEFKERSILASYPKRQGWRHIAWAFLKLRGANNRVNLEQRLRLQLYCYPNRQHTESRDDRGFQAWYHGHRIKYPSTLHVTAKPVLMQQNTVAALRSCAPNQPEIAAARLKTPPSSLQTSWSRQVGEKCQVPNTPLLSFSLSGSGGSVLKFSPDGNHLAVSVALGEQSEVCVYDVPSCDEGAKLKGHQGLIYDISWSPRSLLLVTASQDTTARVWSLSDSDNHVSCYKMLPHPSFVYACSFHPSSEVILLTAGFDRVVRVWGISALGVNSSQILREFRSHSGYINCLTFDMIGVKMFSGDSEGCVYIWQMSLSSSSSSPCVEEVGTWRELDMIDLKEIRGISIRSIFPIERRLLLHTNDGALRLVDMRRQGVLKRYLVDSPNKHPLSRCTISPCSTNIYLGTDTELCVWNIENESKIHSLSLEQLTIPSASIVCVDYHPLDHIIAMCTYGTSGSILISKYTPQIYSYNSAISGTAPTLPSVCGDTLNDTAMVVMKDKIRQRLNSIPSSHHLLPTANRRPVSTSWDSLGSLTTSPPPLFRGHVTTQTEDKLDELFESPSKFMDSELTLEMLERSVDIKEHTLVRYHTPLYSTSDSEGGERVKRSGARRRRSIHKQRAANMQSIPAE
ncbi:Jouberin [Oopsacas minuta]|uniref:Jouberin n=1 Tax=Oopsacas minuta TaxID=111878 RepID=A0AAV7JCT3_9METZ|nr:Jouberin [Oopsacas minuta]